MSRQPEQSVEARRAWMTVAGREISLKLRDKSFAISLAFTIVSIIGAVAVPALLGDREQTTVVAVAGTSSSQVVERASSLATDDQTITAAPYDATDQVVRAVADEKADLGLVTGAGGETELIGRTSTDSAAADLVREAHAELAVGEVLGEAGVDPRDLASESALSTRTLMDQQTSDGAVRATAVILAIAFYLLALMFGATVAQSVLEEKQNRIVEIVAALVPLRALLLGKLVASSVVAFIQVSVLAVATVVVLRVADVGVALPRLGASVAWFVAFFVVGYLAVAALWAVAGALATRQDDLQHTATPVSTLLIIVIPVGLFLSDTWLAVASYVPIANVVAMPTRVMAGDASWWEPVVSLVVLAGFALAVVRLAAAVYRRSLMQTRSRLTIRQALKVAQ